MDDSSLADAIIERLNALVADPDIRDDVGRLLDSRIVCSQKTTDHPTLQVYTRNTTRRDLLGMLGVLNGVVGVIGDGKLKGFGYVAAVYGDDGKLQRFRRTDAG